MDADAEDEDVVKRNVNGTVADHRRHKEKCSKRMIRLFETKKSVLLATLTTAVMHHTPDGHPQKANLR